MPDFTVSVSINIAAIPYIGPCNKTYTCYRKKHAYKMIDKWQKKVSILEPAAEAVVDMALFIEVKGSMPSYNSMNTRF